MRKCWSLAKARWGSQPTCFGARFKDVMSMPGPGIVTHFFCSLLSTFLPLSVPLNGSLGWVSKLKGLKWSRFNRNNSLAELVTCHVDGFVGDFQGLHNWHKAPGGSQHAHGTCFRFNQETACKEQTYAIPALRWLGSIEAALPLQVSSKNLSSSTGKLGSPWTLDFQNPLFIYPVYPVSTSWFELDGS